MIEVKFTGSACGHPEAGQKKGGRSRGSAAPRWGEAVRIIAARGNDDTRPATRVFARERPANI